MNAPASFLAAPAGDPAMKGVVTVLNRLLAACHPEHVLLAVGEGQEGPDPAGDAPCRIDVRAASGSPLTERYDAAVLFRLEAGGEGQRQEATHLLAALRDVYAGEVLV